MIGLQWTFNTVQCKQLPESLPAYGQEHTGHLAIDLVWGLDTYCSSPTKDFFLCLDSLTILYTVKLQNMLKWYIEHFEPNQSKTTLYVINK